MNDNDDNSDDEHENGRRWCWFTERWQLFSYHHSMTHTHTYKHCWHCCIQNDLTSFSYTASSITQWCINYLYIFRLRKKANDRNPDEFYFKMNNSKLHNGLYMLLKDWYNLAAQYHSITHIYQYIHYIVYFITVTGKHMDIKNQNSRNLTRSSTSTSTAGASSTGAPLDADMLYLLKSQDLG